MPRLSGSSPRGFCARPFVYNATAHHEDHAPHGREISERVAVQRNDIETLRGQLAPNAVYLQSGQGAGVEFQSPLGNTLLRDAIDQMKFDFLSVRELNVSAGRQTKRGKADFQVLCAGTWLPKAGGSALNFPPTSSSWSFGLQQRKDGSWLVDRITPTQLPGGRSGQSYLPSFLNR